MDDRDLEARLSAHLRERFDNVRVPASLPAAVDQAMTAHTLPKPIALPVIRLRTHQLGWAALLTVGLILAIAFTGGPFGEVSGPGAPSPTPHVTESGGADRHFIVLPPAGYVLDKTNGTLASDVLASRLRALLFVGDSPNAFTMAVGNAITVIAPAGGVTDDSIRSVLRAPGVIAFVGLPGSSPGTSSSAAIGQNPPDGATQLFGSDGIETAALKIDQQGRRVLSIALRQSAADALGAFTASHVGGTFAIVVDDDVAFLPNINEPITDGKLQISGGGLPGSREEADFLVSAAIIVGGTLPDEWVIPTVPEVIVPAEIVTRLEFEFGKTEPSPPANVDLEITAADLDAILVGPRWTAVWRLSLDGVAAACPNPLSSDERGICRWTDPEVTHLFDAETGEWLGTAQP